MALNNAFTLTANEIYETLANMIISQEVFADNLGEHQTLVDKARVDGGLYGDTKLYYATDVLKSHDWLNDQEAANLLAIERPQDPEVQAIKLDVFKQIRLTLDNYLTKRAWMNEGAFSSFNGVMLGWMRETKRVYDGTLYNVFIGTTASSVGKQAQEIELPAGGTEANDKQRAMLIARGLADLFVQMSDYNRDFNDYGYFRSYAKDGIKVIWNSKFVNEIRKVDLPTIFHKDGLVDKFEEDVLAPRYFGVVLTSSNLKNYAAATAYSAGDLIQDTTGHKVYRVTEDIAAGSNSALSDVKKVELVVRSMVEKDIGGGSGTASAGTAAQHVFPGDLAPSGFSIAASSATFNYGEAYVEDPDVICKIVVKLPPFMSAFEVGTTFFNPRSLTENHYLTFGHNSLAYLKNYPFITVKAKAKAE